MALFERGDRATPPLNQILYDDFLSLRSARTREDRRIESFFSGLGAAFWDRSFGYTNNQGKEYNRPRTWHAATCSTIRRTIERRSM